MSISVPKRPNRQFIPENFDWQSWNDLQPYFEQLKNQKMASTNAVMEFLRNRSELDSYLSENLAWRYIKMTCDTASETAQADYAMFINNVQPKWAEFSNTLNTKLLKSSYFDKLEGEAFEIIKRNLANSKAIFRKKNIALETKGQTLATQYQATIGGMMVEWKGEKITLQKAANELLNTDRQIRKQVYDLMVKQRLSKRKTIDGIFSKLVKIRHKVALNAGFENFRDYMFVAMNRADYTPSDCKEFHSSLASVFKPLLNEMATERKKRLQLSDYKPFDDKVDENQLLPLKPFQNGQDLLEKTKSCFAEIHPLLSDTLKIMEELGHFDLESRMGKAPGGYNYPLEEIGVPFIFMNATGNVRDLVTMVHEGGHAVHSIVSRELELQPFKSLTMEVAELASMSMELISMEHWHWFFANEQDLVRAKLDHLRDIIQALPWIACIDKFQHWLYENPEHSQQERAEQWVKIYQEFSDDVTDWYGYETARENIWHKQLHLFEVPFYYIEYGIAQLGALAMWRSYKKDPKTTIENYLSALKLGNTKSIKSLYETAGIKFDFSKNYIQELVGFVQTEIKTLQAKLRP